MKQSFEYVALVDIPEMVNLIILTPFPTLLSFFGAVD
jgi:hypothetical protein